MVEVFGGVSRSTRDGEGMADDRSSSSGELTQWEQAPGIAACSKNGNNEDEQIDKLRRRIRIA